MGIDFMRMIHKPIQNRFQNYRFMGIILINTLLWALINAKKDKNKYYII
jgi:hypothetical protein